MFQKLISIFDSSEKWDAFIELDKSKDKIVKYWQKIFLEKIRKKVEENKSSDWKFRYWREFSYGWYLEKSGPESLYLLLEDNCFSIWINSNYFNSQLIAEQYKTSRLFSFFHSSEISNGGNYLAKKEHYFKDDNIFDINHISWFMGNDNQEFIDKLYEDLSSFMDNEEIISLFKEINENARIK